MLQQSVTQLVGVGKKRASELERIGIVTLADLLEHYPYRYEDRTQLKPIGMLLEGATETICGDIVQVQEAFPRRGLRILRVQVSCATGNVVLTWFNQNHIKAKLLPGTKIIATGKVGKGFVKPISVIDYELMEEGDDPTDFQRIVPVYRGTEKVNSKQFRKMIDQALQLCAKDWEEYLSEDIRREYHLMPYGEAMEAIHHPADWNELNMAHYRLVNDEFLTLILGLQMGKVLQEEEGIAHQTSEALANQFLRQLPFQLTNGQKKVILEIKKDMEQPHPMHRLVQGDVGSGKTMVAVYALLKAVSGGYQGAMMAPTEILAEQHYLNLKKLLEPIGVRVVLLKSSLTKKEKDETLAQIADGTAQIIVGTHAVIQQSVTFKQIGIVVIDEQHRFGVKQQVALQQKGMHPDVLVMTATPIPRSLALTLYGDMDLSVIDELPAGRQPIKTYCVSERKRQGMYQFTADALAKGQQAYVICPLVEESEKMDLENVTALAERLQHTFPQYHVGLLHGKMPAAEKQACMEQFRAGNIHLLVATTVVEVGVDVPNATIMIIENAERFGLAQLHQLRGRVGRGTLESHCFLMADPKTEESKQRMAIMVKSNDGFQLAEEDLRIRGTGEVLGTRQHGLPDLKIADLLQDMKILERSKKIAESITEEGLDKEKYSQLRKRMRDIYARNVRNIASE